MVANQYLESLGLPEPTYFYGFKLSRALSPFQPAFWCPPICETGPVWPWKLKPALELQAGGDGVWNVVVDGGYGGVVSALAHSLLSVGGAVTASPSFRFR
jgi:hypothetical protein